MTKNTRINTFANYHQSQKLATDFTSNEKSVFTSNFFFLKIVNSTQIWKILFFSESLNLRTRSTSFLQSRWKNWASFWKRIRQLFLQVLWQFWSSNQKFGAHSKFLSKTFSFLKSWGSHLSLEKKNHWKILKTRDFAIFYILKVPRGCRKSSTYFEKSWFQHWIILLEFFKVIVITCYG